MVQVSSFVLDLVIIFVVCSLFIWLLSYMILLISPYFLIAQWPADTQQAKKNGIMTLPDKHHIKCEDILPKLPFFIFLCRFCMKIHSISLHQFWQCVIMAAFSLFVIIRL